MLCAASNFLCRLLLQSCNVHSRFGFLSAIISFVSGAWLKKLFILCQFSVNISALKYAA